MRIRKVDKNQPEIVAAFRKLGFSVSHTHMVGDGFPDICIGRNNHTHLIEIKDGSKPPSLQKLTPAESDFFSRFSGSKFIVSSTADVENLAKKLP